MTPAHDAGCPPESRPSALCPATRQQARDPTMTLASNAPKPVRHLLDALARELGYLAETLDDEDNPQRDRLEYRAYAVLTVCRILCTHAHAEMAVVSKPAAADWALTRLPMRWHPLIELARAVDEGLEDEDLAPEPVRDFVDFGAESIIGPPEHRSDWTWARSG